MIEKVLIMICILALGLFPAFTDFNQTTCENLGNELARSEREKDALEAKMYELTDERDQLQKEIKELTESHHQLQAALAKHEKLQEQVDELTRFRTELQKKNDELTKSRDAAAAEVQAAKLRIDALTKSHAAAVAEADDAKQKIDELEKKLETETEKVRMLQDQLKQVQAALAELKSTLKL